MILNYFTMAYPFKMGYAVGLTFFVAAHHASHVVPVETRQGPVDPEPEAVPGPLKHPLLVLDPAWQGHVLTLDRDLPGNEPRTL